MGIVKGNMDEGSIQSKKEINHYTALKGQIKALQNSCEEKDEESDNEQEYESNKESETEDEDCSVQFPSTQSLQSLGTFG